MNTPTPGRTARYADPLDLIWLDLARQLGLRVVRSAEVFASWDGQGTLTLAREADFDPDDSLAQLVLHEVCHALVEGPEALAQPDWGLCNHTDRHLAREHACHRLQAALLRAHGLRWVLAPTTEHRPYYDGLPEDPLGDPPPGAAEDPALLPARLGHARAQTGPWAAPLAAALADTAAVAAVARRRAPADSVFARFGV